MLTSLRGKLIFIFILLTVSVVIISSGFARYKQQKFALDMAQERAKVDLQLLDSDIHSVFSWIRRDLLMLLDLSSLHEMLNAPSSKERSNGLKELQNAFLSLATHHKIFQQIRIIGADGNELIRVDTKGEKVWLTPQHLLQNKSNRYYFRQAINLQEGRIYISPMDLNIEQGKIEQPFVPVIRYATPITDDLGKKRGILILNVLGSTFLDLLQDHQEKASPGTVYYLLNRDGYFLFHRDQRKRFGFMFNNEENFFNDEPDLKNLILKQSQGTLFKTSEETYHQTLFTFKRINPVPLDSTESPDYWILLTTVDNAELLVGMDEHIQIFIPFTFLLIVLCIGAAVLVAWNCSRPIVSLASAAKQIQGGDLSARAQIYTSDDMGKFGNLFNNMATKLEQTISKLRLSESKYRQIFENSRDCIFVTDMHFNIMDINDAGKTLFGVDERIGTEQLFLKCFRASDGKKDTPFIQEKIQEKGYIKDHETWLQRVDGSTRHCTLTATSRYDDIGTPLGYEGILRDITQEKQRQQAEQEFNKKLQEEVILAEERERRHMGQVLHEEMAQNLALVNLKMQEVEKKTLDLPASQQTIIRGHIGDIRMLIKLMIRQIRTMIFDLYPVILDNQGLVPAMNWYGDNFTRRTGIEVSVYGISGSLGLSESQKIYLFRSFKELLHNAWKHADAKEIVATVKKKDRHVRLTVDDAGKGFQPEKIGSGNMELKGIGLVSIRQWITAINGTMSIESEPDKGTRISIDIPLEQLEELP